MSKKVMIRDVAIGDGNPIAIQSMSNADSRNEKKITEQIRALEEAGCDIIRLAVPDRESLDVFRNIRTKTDIPLVADIHFDYRLAIIAMENGADKIRLNPGNIGGKGNIKKVVDVARERKIPIRIGVNSGSLERDILRKYGGVTARGMVESAQKNIDLLQEFNFDDIVVSLKASNPKLNFESYRMMSAGSQFPLHVGVTEAGTFENGKIKSAVGIGALLLLGIGDTIRVSLTGDPLNEIKVAKSILEAAGLHLSPIEMISCPTCGRTGVDLSKIAEEIEKAMKEIAEKRSQKGMRPLKVAVMGCEVNGPGEAKDADLGVACGKGKGAIFINGKIVKTVDERQIKSTILDMVEHYEEYI